MVRNAYGMAIPKKNLRFSLRKIDEKMKWLEMGRQTSFSRSVNFVVQDFLSYRTSLARCRIKN